MKTPTEPCGRNFRRSLNLCLSTLMLSLTASNAEVKLTFDTDMQGFIPKTTTGTSPNNGNATTAEWVNDPEFGGCIAITVANDYRPQCVEMNLYAAANVAFRTELENAAGYGGTLKFTVHVRPADVLGGNPRWFEFTTLNNSAGIYALDKFGQGGFPLTSTLTRVIEIPVQGVAAAGPGVSSYGNDTTYQYLATSSYNQLSLGLNSDSNADFGGGPNTFAGATFYIDDVTVTGTPPPVAGSYTFDTGKLGFKRFEAHPDPAYSSNYGGTLEFAALDSSFHFWANKNDMTGNELAKLKACAQNGGTISYDLIAPPGYLSSRVIATTVQNQNGTGVPGLDYKWNQVDRSIPPTSVRTLPDGHQVARINIPATAFTDLASANGYNFIIGFNGFNTTPVSVYFDNLTFSPNSAGSQLTFDSGVQNFQNIDGSVGANTGGVELNSLFNGNILGAKAVFTSTNPDPKVVAVHTSLATAAARGGLLKLKITKATLPNRDVPFTGVTVRVGYNPTTGESNPTVQRSITIPASAFTANDNLETPAGFSKTIRIPLYPTGSTATDGFVLGDGADYKFFIGTEVYDAASVKISFDDFQVCPAADPEIIYSPVLPSGSSGIVGRVLGNADPGATFSATGLPPGVTLDVTTGLLTGNPTANGTYDITYSVTKFGITDTTESIQWVVSGIIGPAIPVINSFAKNTGTAVIAWSGTGATPVTVSRSTTLAPGDWEAISTGNVTGTYTDTSAPAGKCFYRVSVP